MDKIDMICTSGPFGDCCSAYKVVLHHEYTVKEYVEEVLKTKQGEWGTFKIWQEEQSYKELSKELDCCDYKKGEKINDFKYSTTWNSKIEEVKAYGGWTYMDYFIKIK